MPGPGRTRRTPGCRRCTAPTGPGLPPAVIVTAEYDPLRDEGEAYGQALQAAGVRADVQRYDGMIHGFFDMGTVSPAAQAAIEDSCARFRKVLHG